MFFAAQSDREFHGQSAFLLCSECGLFIRHFAQQDSASQHHRQMSTATSNAFRRCPCGIMRLLRLGSVVLALDPGYSAGLLGCAELHGLCDKEGQELGMMRPHNGWERLGAVGSDQECSNWWILWDMKWSWQRRMGQAGNVIMMVCQTYIIA